jgi:hypothetical protein
MNKDAPVAVWNRLQQLMDRVPRPAKIAAAGYLIVAVFGIGADVARLRGVGPTIALIVGAVVASPLALAFVGDRIAGIKAFSLEISLSEVTMPVEGNFTGAIMATAEMGPSASPDLIQTFQSAMQGRAKVMRVNLRDNDYWWSTRVFLIAALAEDYTGVDALAFVRAGEDRIFVGIAAPHAVRKRLGSRFPDYEIAYRKVRAETVGGASPDPCREVQEILMWRWPQALQPSEQQIRLIVRADDLKMWLDGELDDESLPFGPLTSLLRYRITARSRRFAALTDKSRLVAIVDRDELARRASLVELEHRFI